MSHLPEQAVQEFREIWKKDFGEEISEEYARVRAHEVFAVLRLVLQKKPDLNSEITPEEIPDALTQLKRMRTEISVNNDEEPIN